jgi:hypothetical protein
VAYFSNKHNRSRIEADSESSGEANSLVADDALRGINPASLYEEQPRRSAPAITVIPEPLQSNQWSLKANSSVEVNVQPQALSTFFSPSHQSNGHQSYGSTIQSLADSPSLNFRADMSSRTGDSWELSSSRLEALAAVATESNSSSQTYTTAYPSNTQSPGYEHTKEEPSTDNSGAMLESLEAAITSNLSHIRGDGAAHDDNVLRQIAEAIALRTASNANSPRSASQTRGNSARQAKIQKGRNASARKTDKATSRGDLLDTLVLIFEAVQNQSKKRQDSNDGQKDGSTKCPKCSKTLKRICDLKFVYPFSCNPT